MKLVWFPQWLCQNYTFGESYGKKCPYCPYSLDKKTNRLIFDNKVTGSNEIAPYENVLGFFRNNAQVMNWHVEISGGEPLLYTHLAKILGPAGLGEDWTWSITSNTLNAFMLGELNGTYHRCTSWTASYHPVAKQEKVFEQNIKLLKTYGAESVTVTVVVSEHTFPVLKEAVDFLNTLPIRRYQFHIDSHQPGRNVEELRKRAEEIVGPNNVFAAGDSPKGNMCDRHSKLMAVSPDGTLYECVTKCYQDIDPICKVDENVILSDLPVVVKRCPLECFACCDHVKHMNS